MALAEHTTETTHALPAEVNPTVMPRRELVENNRDFHWITEKVCRIVEGPTPRWWWICFTLSVILASFTVGSIIYLIAVGTGTWGLRSPVNWGWAIVNFVFWVGIGHAGTLISAILCLLRQKWSSLPPHG